MAFRLGRGLHNCTDPRVSAMWGGTWDVRRFEEIDSTNAYLRREARAGAPEGVVAVADHQSAGRGRMDRRWESPPGASLLVSVLFRPEFDPSELHLCTAALALAAAEACRRVAGVDAVIKWPNDLLVGNAKLAGVLAEAEFLSGELRPRGRARAQRRMAGSRRRGRHLPERSVPRPRWTATPCWSPFSTRSRPGGSSSTAFREGGKWRPSYASAAPRWDNG